MKLFNKKELIKQIEIIKNCVKQTEKGAMFHAAFIFSGINKEFLKLKKNNNIEEVDLSIKPNVFTRQKIIAELDNMRNIVSKCKKNVLFKAVFMFDELDKDFMEIAKQAYIKKGLEEKRKQETKGNI